MTFPGEAETLALALRGFPKGARVAVHHDGPWEEKLLSTGAFSAVGAFPAPIDACLAPELSSKAPLIPTLVQLHDALAPGGRAIVTDVVWHTAPTPALALAFAPARGREKVRPIEGYEMQIEHAGFRIVERVDLKRDAWLRALASDDPRRPAIEADARGAARACAWLLER